MTSESDTIHPLHHEYCRLVGFNLALTIERHYWWTAWLARGWTMEDLRLVIRYLQQQIKEGKRNSGALKWSNLIQDANRYEEDLQMARAEQRNRRPPPAPLERVIGQWSPKIAPGDPKGSAIHISKVIEAMREAAS